MPLRKVLFIALLLIPLCVSAQKVDKIFVNLYTDSLKKGTYNYINIDGLLSNGKYIPLDSSHIILWASDGKFYGNELWIDKNFTKDKVSIKVTLKNEPGLSKEFTMFIKKKTDDEKLKTTDELLKEMGQHKKKKINKLIFFTRKTCPVYHRISTLHFLSGVWRLRVA